MTGVALEILVALQQWQEGFGSLARADLCGLTGCSDREVRQAVAELRRNGHLVVPAQGGYRLAESADEVTTYTATLRERVHALATVINAMEAAASSKWGGNGC